jgi:hypothetical protein
MKKLLVVSAVLLLTAAFCLPAAQARVKIGAGGEFGLNIASMSVGPQDIQGKKSRTGVMFGGIVCFAFNDWVALQPGVRYSMKGVGQDTQDQNNQNVSITDKFDYFEIPVYFRFSIPTGTLFTPNFVFGPVLGIMLSHKYTYSDVNQSLSGSIPNTKALDFGLGFGGGGRFELGPGDAFLNLYYDLGLNSAVKSPGANSLTLKNRVLTFAVGYIFNFKQPSAAPASHRRTHG